MGGLRASSNLTTPDFDHDESPFPGLVRWRYWLAKRPPKHERLRRANLLAVAARGTLVLGTDARVGECLARVPAPPIVLTGQIPVLST